MTGRFSDILAFVIKLLLGITFIYASYHKIEDPAAFAKVIYGYGVFPRSSINILAITIPFIELTAGFSLLLGLFPKSALLIINVLLAAFIVVIAFNLIRGHEFDCGCFSFGAKSSHLSNVSLLVRDVVMLGGGLFLFRKIKAS